MKSNLSHSTPSSATELDDNRQTFLYILNYKKNPRIFLETPIRPSASFPSHRYVVSTDSLSSPGCEGITLHWNIDIVLGCNGFPVTQIFRYRLFPKLDISFILSSSSHYTKVRSRSLPTSTAGCMKMVWRAYILEWIGERAVINEDTLCDGIQCVRACMRVG